MTIRQTLFGFFLGIKSGAVQRAIMHVVSKESQKSPNSPRKTNKKPWKNDPALCPDFWNFTDFPKTCITHILRETFTYSSVHFQSWIPHNNTYTFYTNTQITAMCTVHMYIMYDDNNLVHIMYVTVYNNRREKTNSHNVWCLHNITCSAYSHQ